MDHSPKGRAALNRSTLAKPPVLPEVGSSFLFPPPTGLLKTGERSASRRPRFSCLPAFLILLPPICPVAKITIWLVKLWIVYPFVTRTAGSSAAWKRGRPFWPLRDAVRQIGLAGARAEAIAAAAGVNKALLYYYFKSKESLYEAVVEDHFAEFNRQALLV